MDFKNSIQLGVKIDPKNTVEQEIKTIVDKLNKNEIKLDISIKDNNVAQQLKLLTDLAEKFQNIIGKDISMGDLSKSVNDATQSIAKLKNEMSAINFDELQNKLISDFGEKSGLASAGKFSKSFKDTIKQSLETGDFDKIFTETLRKTEEDIIRINKEASANMKKIQLEGLEGILEGNALKLNSKGKLVASGMKVSLAGLEFDKSEMEELKRNFGKYIQIDNSSFTKMDGILTEIIDKAKSFGRELDKSMNPIEHTLEYSRLINEYRNVKAGKGESGGLSSEEEEQYLNKTLECAEKLTKEYQNLVKQKELYSKLNSIETINKENESLDKQNESLNKQVQVLEKIKTEKENLSKVSVDRDNSTEVEKHSSTYSTLTGQTTNSFVKFPDGSLTKDTTKIVNDYEKLNKVIMEVENSLKELKKLDANGIIDKNKIMDVTEKLEGIKSFPEMFNSNDLKQELNTVKQLVATENSIIQYNNKLTSLKASLSDVKLPTINGKVDDSGLNKLISDIDKARKSLTGMSSINENGLKIQFDNLSKSVSQFVKETNQAKKSTEELTQLGKLKSQAYEKIDTLKVNKIVNPEDIRNLEKMVASVTRLKDMTNVMGNIKSTMSKETQILGMSKQIDEAIQKINKLKETLGNNAPSGFLEGTEEKIRKLQSELSRTGNLNFTGMKQSLNSVNAEIKQATVQTEQLRSASNGSFFTGIGDFLGKAGLFYGVGDVIQRVRSELSKATEYTIQMDTHMSNIQMITGDTRANVEVMTKSLKDLAGSLHTTNSEMMAGAEEMLRAGYSDEDSKKMMESAIIGGKISGQTTQEVAEQLITLKNSFNISADSMSNVIDMFSKMDNVSATSFKEIADAIQRTAYSAQQAGVPLETLTAYITTTSEKTRRTAETIGESYKSIFSRYQNIKLGNIDEDGKTINDTETAMNRIGISIRDSKNSFKDFNTVLNEFMDKIRNGSISQVDMLAGVQALAGTRQKEALLSLIQNMDDLKRHQEEIKESTGSAKKMFDEVYGNSLDAKINDLKRAFEGLYEKILNSDMLKSLLDMATKFINFLTSIDGATWKLIGTVSALGVALKVLGGFSFSLGGLANLGNLSKDVGVVSTLGGSFTKLGTNIKSATMSALGFIKSPLGLAIAGVTTATALGIKAWHDYNDVMSKPTISTTTDDLSGFEKVINSLTGNVIQSKQALIESNMAYEDFGNGLSDKFKDSVENASKSFNELKMSLAFDGEADIFTDDMSNKIKSQIDGMVSTTKQSILDSKGDLEKSFSELFTSTDGGLDESELQVLNSITDYQSEKFNAVQELNDNIYKRLNQAVSEHRQLTQEDIDTIKDWATQIQAIQIQANTQNEADGEYASNLGKFEKRLSSMTPDEALSSTKDAYNQVIEISQKTEDESKKVIEKANGFKEELEASYSKAIANNDNAGAEKIKSMIDKITEETTKAQDNLNNQVKKRREETDKLWEAFYKVNPNMRDKVNQVTFEQFTGKDIKANGDFNKIMKWYPQLADVTETSMQRIQNADKSWSDVAVTVDEATGKIVSIYDTTTGQVAGYSQKFKDDAKATYDSVYQAQNKLTALLRMNKEIKITDNNDLVSFNPDGTKNVIENMKQVIELANGYKVAVANINGKQIKFEFDGENNLKNYKDIMDALNDKKSKAVVDFDVSTEEGKRKLREMENDISKIDGKEIKPKIIIDGTEIPTIDEAIQKLNDLKETNPDAKIIIDGQEIPTIDEAIQKLQEIPSSTSTSITIDGTEVSTIDEAIAKLNELKETNPDSTIVINGEQIPTIDEAIQKLNEIQNTNPNSKITVESQQANQDIDNTQQNLNNLDNTVSKPQVKLNADNVWERLLNIKNTLEWIGGRVVSATVKVFSSLTGTDEVQHNAKGTNNARRGLSEVAEDGFEIIMGRQFKKLRGGETILNNKTSKEFLKALRTVDEEENIPLAENISDNIDVSNEVNKENEVSEKNSDEENNTIATANETPYIEPVILETKVPDDIMNKPATMPDELENEVVVENVEELENTPMMARAKKKDPPKVPDDHDDGYFPWLNVPSDSGSSSSSSSSSSSKGSSSSSSKGSKKSKSDKELDKALKKAEAEAKKAEKFRKAIDRLHSDLDIDVYYDENNALKEVENRLNENKTAMEGYDVASKDYQDHQKQEIELLRKKQDAMRFLIEAEKNQSNAIRDKLQEQGFLFDSNGNLINSEERLLELENQINAESGDTEEAKQKKQDDIAWLKDMNSLVKEYGKLTRETLPKAYDDFNAINNEIKKINEEMQKTNINTVNTFRNSLVQAILKENQEKVDAMKEELADKQKEELEQLSEEKKAMEDAYDAEIKRYQDQLEALNDDSEDKQNKLNELKKQKALWEKDDSVFAKAQIEKLNKDIASLEKEIQKDSLQNKIDNLEDKKKVEQDDYDRQEEELKKRHEEELKEKDKLYKDLLDEKKAYAQADKLITENNQQEMLRLLSKYDESYKDIGTQLATSLTNPFVEQFKNVQNAWNELNSQFKNPNSSSSGGSSSSSGSSGGSGSWWGADVGDHVWITDSQKTQLYKKPGDNSIGTTWDNGVGSSDELVVSKYYDGYIQLKDKHGNIIGWVDRYDVTKWSDAPTFMSGGRTPDNIGDKGMSAILHGGEKILNRRDTNMIDRIDSYVEQTMHIVKDVDSMFNSVKNPFSNIDLSSMYTPANNIPTSTNQNTNNVSMSNTINVTNNTKDDSYFNAKSLDRMLKQQINKFK